LKEDARSSFVVRRSSFALQAAPDYILLLNPDTVVHAGAVEALAAFLGAHPRVGAVGPRLLNSDGTVQPAAFRFPTLAMAALDLFPPGEVLPGRLYNSWWHGRYPQERTAAEPFPIDHPLGACILTRPAVLGQVGLLDERFFMYAEEVDWCLRVRRAGWAIWQEPRARVTHVGGAATSQFRSRMLVALYEARLRFFRKHYAPRVVRWHTRIVRAGMLRAALLAWRDFARGRLAREELRARLWAYGLIMQNATCQNSGTCCISHFTFCICMLSVAIIARDEERHIGAALDSVAGLAGEALVLLDSRTRDRTADICRERGARVVAEPWRGIPAQRKRALDLFAGEWVLFLDADERVTPELRAELLGVGDWGLGTESFPKPNPQPPIAGYWIPRRNLFFGRALRGGGWYPDHQLRLLRRGRARYDEARLVHELVQLDGAQGYLQGHLLHLNIERLGELWRKQAAYAIQEAQTLALAGGWPRWRSFLGAPAREFYRRYIRLGGYRDGAVGLLLCATLAYFELVKLAHLKGLGRALSR
jgi:GT2 family glycosyltransferase